MFNFSFYTTHRLDSLDEVELIVQHKLLPTGDFLSTHRLPQEVFKDNTLFRNANSANYNSPRISSPANDSRSDVISTVHLSQNQHFNYFSTITLLL